MNLSRVTNAVAMGAVLSLTAVGCDDASFDQGQASQAANQGQGRYIVQYHAGNRGAARAAAQRAGGNIVVDLSKHNAFAAHLPAAAVNALASNSAVKLVEPDVKR